ncbi:hypothetical protein J4413_04885 [Candidatus Woesearchaeota archaeon]|nr:hypothetical protein [Candidatus Woesearchaeota archaeon]
MAKFQEALNRIQTNIYVCRKCKSKIRTKPLSVLLQNVKCRKCGHKALRALRKK